MKRAIHFGAPGFNRGLAELIPSIGLQFARLCSISDGVFPRQEDLARGTVVTNWRHTTTQVECIAGYAPALDTEFVSLPVLVHAPRQGWALTEGGLLVLEGVGK